MKVIYSPTVKQIGNLKHHSCSNCGTLLGMTNPKETVLEWLDKQPMNFCPRCGVKLRVVDAPQGEAVTDADIDTWFNPCWEKYPRKVSKVQARKTFEKKLTLSNKETAIEDARKIYKMLVQQIENWEEEEREITYIPHFASWLNNNFSDKSVPKGKRK